MAADIATGNKADQIVAAASVFPRHEQTFPALTPQEIARMRRFGEERKYKHGESLFETGKPGPGMFVILSGMLPSRSAMVSATSRLSSIRGRVSLSLKSASSRAASRWSTATPRATLKRC